MTWVGKDCVAVLPSVVRVMTPEVCMKNKTADPQAAHLFFNVFPRVLSKSPSIFLDVNFILYIESVKSVKIIFFFSGFCQLSRNVINIYSLAGHTEIGTEVGA